MGLTLKLLGPDVPQDLSISVDVAHTIQQVKETAHNNWPPSDGA